MEWKEVDIEQTSIEIIDGDRGKNYPKNNELTNSGYCLFLSAANVTKNGLQFSNNSFITKEKDALLRKGKLMPKDIVLTTRGTVGNVGFYSDDVPYPNMRINSGMVIIRPGEDFDTMFLYQYLRSCYFRAQITQFQSGSAQPQLPISTLQKMKVIKPDIDAQRRIASILSSLDRKIELNNKINADLEEMAQAIFKNWFVDFEPFKDGKFVDSELGMIPEGWKVGTLKDLLYLRKDSIKAANKGNLPYLPIDTIPMHCLVATDFKSNDEAKSSLQTFEQNDIVVGAMRVYFHRVILAPCKGITRTTCFVLSVKNENALAYSLMQCNQDEAISFAEKTSKGSTMPYAVWDGGYGEYKVVIPPSEVMKSFNDLLSNFFSKMNKNAIENSRLSLLRDTLLPRLMSGELEVPE